MDGIERLCRIVGVQAALLTAAAHLLWLGSRLSWPPFVGVEDVRPYLFVVAAVTLVITATATYNGTRERRIHALTIGTLGALLAGYPIWHGTDTMSTLLGDPVAIVAKAAEIVGLLAFVGLYWLHHPDRLGPDAIETDGSAESAGITRTDE